MAWDFADECYSLSHRCPRDAGTDHRRWRKPRSEDRNPRLSPSPRVLVVGVLGTQPTAPWAGGAELCVLLPHLWPGGARTKETNRCCWVCIPCFLFFLSLYLFIFVVTLTVLLKLRCRSGLSAASRALSGCSPHTDLALLLQTDSAHSSAGSTSRSLSLHLCSSMRPIPGAGSSSGWRTIRRHKANLRSPQALSWLGPCSHRLLLQPQCGLSGGNTGWRIVPFISLSSCFFFLEEKKKKSMLLGESKAVTCASL